MTTKVTLLIWWSNLFTQRKKKRVGSLVKVKSILLNRWEVLNYFYCLCSIIPLNKVKQKILTHHHHTNNLRSETHTLIIRISLGIQDITHKSSTLILTFISFIGMREVNENETKYLNHLFFHKLIITKRILINKRISIRRQKKN